MCFARKKPWRQMVKDNRFVWLINVYILLDFKRSLMRLNMFSFIFLNFEWDFVFDICYVSSVCRPISGFFLVMLSACTLHLSVWSPCKILFRVRFFLVFFYPSRERWPGFCLWDQVKRPLYESANTKQLRLCAPVNGVNRVLTQAVKFFSKLN